MFSFPYCVCMPKHVGCVFIVVGVGVFVLICASCDAWIIIFIHKNPFRFPTSFRFYFSSSLFFFLYALFWPWPKKNSFCSIIPPCNNLFNTDAPEGRETPRLVSLSLFSPFLESAMSVSFDCRFPFFVHHHFFISLSLEKKKFKQKKPITPS